MPTLALVATQRVLATDTPRQVRDRVEERLSNGTVSTSARTMLIPALIADLKSDDIRWNADRARSMLEQMGPEVVPALEETLLSSDVQQRHLAGMMLLGLEGDFPSSRLLDWCMDQLRDDGIDGNAHTITTTFAQRDPAILIPRLERALHGEDAQARGLAARLLAWHRVRPLDDLVVPELIRQIEATRGGISSFGAVVALSRLGPVAAQAAARWSDSPSERLQNLSRALTLDVERPHPRTVIGAVIGWRVCAMYGRLGDHDNQDSAASSLCDSSY